VPASLADGQHVRCPYCGEKSEFSKPRRIELPTGARRVTPEPPPPPAETETTRQKLKVIRSGASTAPDLYVESQMRRLEENDQERLTQEMADQAKRHREWIRAFLRNTFALLAILGVLALGFFAYLTIDRRRSEEKHRQQLLLRAAEEERAERERQNEEERLKREEERKAEKAKEAADRKAAAEKAEATRQLELKTQKEQAAAKEFYARTLATFDGWKFHFISDLKKEVQTAPDGESYYLLPSDGKQSVRIGVVRTENGVSTAYRLSEEGEKETVDVQEFRDSLEKLEYLVATGTNVYFKALRAKPHVSEIPTDKEVDLTDAFFGSLSPVVKQLELDFEDLSFELVFRPDKTKKNILSQVVSFGMPYSLEKVREAIEEEYPPKELKVKATRQKKFKRTVVYWDGAHIKRGIDGVMYVPRTPPTATKRYRHGHRTYGVIGDGWYYNKSYSQSADAYEHWQSLCKRADQEDQDERDFLARQEEERKAQIAQQSEAEKEKYRQKIDGIIRNGHLFWRARIR